jgi:hypothetical protein
MPIDKVRVKLGGHRMNDGLSYRVVSATVHPGYHHVRGDFNHDVALLRLSGAGAHLDHNVKPICLLKSGNVRSLVDLVLLLFKILLVLV